MKAIKCVLVDVNKGFRIDGNRLRDAGDVYTYRPDKPPKIENGYLVKHANGYTEFLTEDQLKECVFFPDVEAGKELSQFKIIDSSKEKVNRAHKGAVCVFSISTKKKESSD